MSRLSARCHIELYHGSTYRNLTPREVVRLPSSPSLEDSGILKREQHLNIAIHDAGNSCGRQHPDLRTGSRRTMISHLEHV